MSSSTTEVGSERRGRKTPLFFGADQDILWQMSYIVLPQNIITVRGCDHWKIIINNVYLFGG